MKHLLIAFIFGLALVSRAESQTAAPISASAQVPIVNPVTDLKKTVVVITVMCTDGLKILKSQGTGFFVGFSSNDGKVISTYLLTNRHVAFPSSGEVALRVLQTSIRMSKKDGLAIEVLIPPNGQWTVPDEKGTDLAAMGLTPDENTLDFKVILAPMLMDADKMKKEGVAEGQPIFFAGYFKQYAGTTHLEPIVRQGIIAMLPNEKIAEEGGLEGNLYLADTHAFHGNSGSPVFMDLGGFRNGNMMVGSRYVALGVVSGFFSEEAPLRAIQSSTLDGVAESNSGIATIVPAFEVIDLLNSPVLADARNAAFKASGH